MAGNEAKVGCIKLYITWPKTNVVVVVVVVVYPSQQLRLELKVEDGVAGTTHSYSP